MLTSSDFSLFGATLSISFLIGIYFGCFGSKQATTNEYLSGNKKLCFIPVGISIGVSNFSAVAIMGFPADVYRYGSPIILIFITGTIVALLSIYIYLPVFFMLQLASCYDYLERRFDRRTKKLAVFLYILLDFVYFAILVYAPSLTFATATGYSVTTVAFITSAVCFLYTSIGGMKTVIWSDVFQFVIISVCVGFVLGIGLHATGGVSQVWETAQKGERLNVFNFGLDLTQRDTFWTVVVGMTFYMATNILAHQTSIQKYLSLSTFQDSVKSVVWCTVSKFVIVELCAFIGLIIYAKYRNCDLLTAQKIEKHDQLVPYFVQDIAGDVPGFQGLFIATIFSASLSSMSSILNSLSGVVYHDFICSFLETHSEKTRSNILKLTVLVIGILSTSLVFVIQHLGQLVDMIMALKACSNGPLLGIFTLGMLFPRVNSKGAFYGGVCGMVTLFVLNLGSRYYTINKLITYPTKSLSVDGCSGNYTIFFDPEATRANLAVPVIFRVCFYYYTVIGTLITMVMGLAISYLSKQDKSVDKDLINSYFHFLLPKSVNNRNQKGCVKDKRLLEGTLEDL